MVLALCSPHGKCEPTTSIIAFKPFSKGLIIEFTPKHHQAGSIWATEGIIIIAVSP
jgi:hypothetical protein